MTAEQYFTRRQFLRGAGAVIAICATSQGLPLAMASVNKTTKTSRGQASIPAQPQETGWLAKKPPLATPWFSQVSPDNCLPEYPRPQMRRQQWSNLNGVWQFEAASGRGKPPLGQELKERIMVPFPVESALSGIMRHEPHMVYRRRFIVPDFWNITAGKSDLGHQRLLLHFDAVDFEAHVWVNGSFVGSHQGGYDRFSFDVTDALRTDGNQKPNGDQELVVKVFDPTDEGNQPVGKQSLHAWHNPDSALWYSPVSGIWQTVWIEPVPAAHIDRLHMTPNLPASSLHLTVHAINADDHAVEVTAYDGNHAVATATGRPNQDISLPIPKPKLWSPDSPFLYDLKVHLRDRKQTGGQAPSDQVRSYFGMRSIEISNVDGKPHAKLNGQVIFQLSNLQQGYWPDGLYTVPSDEGLRFDLEQTKALGFNTARKHQKIEPDRWYYHADRLGVLVWQDMPRAAVGNQPPDVKPTPYPGKPKHREFEHELRRIVRQQHNHPSIVMWAPFNEGWGEFDLAYIAGLVKRWDPSRLVDEMSGINVAGRKVTAGNVQDVHHLGGNTPGKCPKPEDGRITIIGEFGAWAYSVPNHTWDPAHAHPHIEVGNAKALTKHYVQAMRKIRQFALESHLSGANYNLFADVKHQVNGLYTYDRKVFKANRARVQRATATVISSLAKRYN